MASDGVTPRLPVGAAGRRPLGTVCLLQGTTECIEKYFEVVGDLPPRGFAVATFDWRGQGGSGAGGCAIGARAMSGNFAEYDRDLEAFMQQVDAARLPAAATSRWRIRWAADRVLPRAARKGRRSVRAHGDWSAADVRRSPAAPAACAARRLARIIRRRLRRLDIPGGGATDRSPTLPFEDNPLTSDPRALCAQPRDHSSAAPELAIGVADLRLAPAASGPWRHARMPEIARRRSGASRY